MERFKSRKFILAVLAAGVAFGNAMFDWGFTNDQILTVVAPLLAFIGVEGIADIRERAQS